MIHTPHATVRYDLPWTFSTFDYRDPVRAAGRAGAGRSSSRRPRSNGRTGHTVHTDRGEIRAPLIVDALGWRRVLGAGANVQPPDALLSRGLEVHPFGTGDDLEVWIDRSYVPAGYGWSFPADGELRIGVGSFDPRFHVREPTERLARRPRRRPGPLPGQLDPPRAAGCDRGRRVLRRRLRGPLPAADGGGDPDRAVLRARVRARARERCSRAARPASRRLHRYHAFSAAHARPFRWMLRVQRLIPRVAPRVLGGGLRAIERKRFIDWAFDHYLRVAHPDFVAAARRPRTFDTVTRLRRRGPVAPSCRSRAARPDSAPARRYWCVTCAPSAAAGRRRRTTVSVTIGPWGSLPCAENASIARRRPQLVAEADRVRPRARGWQPPSALLHNSWR